jgi:hypothetical protein
MTVARPRPKLKRGRSMPQIDGTAKRRTFACPQCGAFLWNEGICDPCQGNPVEAEVAEENAVIYAYDEPKGKVVARKRAKKVD